MTHARPRSRWLAAIILLIAATIGGKFGCAKHSRQDPTQQSSASSAKTFERSDLGVRLSLPPGWTKQPSEDFVLLLTRPGDAKGSQISLDVPKLPPHIPGLIPIGSVRNGYVDDLRQTYRGLETKDLEAPDVPGAQRRLVRSIWTDVKGRAQQETALLLVHGDHVYILRGRGPVDDEPATRSAFDAVARSLQWVSGRAGGSPE